MKNLFRPSLALLFLALIVASTHNALATPPGAPEIDPGMGLSGLAVLGTAIAIVRGRRRR